MKAVFLAFLVTRLMVFAVTYLSSAQIPVLDGVESYRFNPSNLIPDGLIRWDSYWYLSIVQEGYTPQSVVFFPLYPLLIRLCMFTGLNEYFSGLLISNIAFFVSLFYIYALTAHEADGDTAGRAVFYLAAAPAAFIFSALYTESLFILLLAASMYYAVMGKWIPAALAGTLASATRMSGILISVFIIFEVFWQQGIRYIPRKPWCLRAQAKQIIQDIRLIPGAWKGILAAIFSTSGLLAYMGYLFWKFSDPLLFLHAEENWDKVVSWNWPARLVQYITYMHRVTGNILAGEIHEFSGIMDTLALIVFIPLVIVVFLKYRPSFGWYTLLAYLMPLASGTPVSMRRYVLVLLPCFLQLAQWGKRVWVDRLILGISLPLQSYLLVLFSHWYWAG